jgi:iron complex outermembrane receptor protein
MNTRFLAWSVAALLLGAGSARALAQEGADTSAPEGAPAAAATPAPEPADAAVDSIPVPAEPPPVEAAPENTMLEDVMVTAQKRRESLSDVPFSVQAFSGEKLDAMGITDQTDLQRITPGLNLTSQVSYVMTFLRGVGTDASIAADPSVATYIDDVYYPFSSNLAQNFGAVDRIEILKGPQGTLFGRNATGGAISIQTRAPEFASFSGELLAEVGSFNSRKARAYLNVPVGETVALNVSAVHTTTDGYYRGLQDTPARPIPGDEATGFRAKVRWQPNADWDINLGATHMVMRLGAGAVGFNAYPSQSGSAQGVTPQTGYEGAVDARVLNDTDPNLVYQGSVAYSAPWFDTKLILSDQRMDTAGSRDFDGSPEALAALETPSQFIDAQSGELQFLSSDRWGPEWLQWIAGGFYFKATQGFGSLLFRVFGVDTTTGTIGGLPADPGLVNVIGAIPSGTLNLVGLVGTESRALFAQTTVTATDWLDVVLGVRFQSEDRFIVKSLVQAHNADGSDTLIRDQSNTAQDGDGNSYAPRDTQEAVTPKVALQFRPFDSDQMIYVSAQKAVKASTYNTVKITDPPDYVEPEEIVAYEAGAKLRFLDGLVRVNPAVFDYDVKNLQTYYLSTQAGGVISFQNAGRASIRGADVDATVSLLPSLIDGLAFNGGVAYLEAEYLEFTDGAGFDDDGNFVTGQDYTGHRVIRTPELSFTSALSKMWWLGGGPVEVVFDSYYTSDFFYEASNRELSRQREYWLHGARVSYLYSGWGLRATLGVRNLTDEFYSAGFFATDYGIQPNWAPPRTYSLQLLWAF